MQAAHKCREVRARSASSQAEMQQPSAVWQHHASAAQAAACSKQQPPTPAAAAAAGAQVAPTSDKQLVPVRAPRHAVHVLLAMRRGNGQHGGAARPRVPQEQAVVVPWAGGRQGEQEGWCEAAGCRCGSQPVNTRRGSGQQRQYAAGAQHAALPPADRPLGPSSSPEQRGAAPHLRWPALQRCRRTSRRPPRWLHGPTACAGAAGACRRRRCCGRCRWGRLPGWLRVPLGPTQAPAGRGAGVQRVQRVSTSRSRWAACMAWVGTAAARVGSDRGEMCPQRIG